MMIKHQRRTSSKGIAILLVLCMLLSSLTGFVAMAEEPAGDETTQPLIESKLLLEEDFDYESGTVFHESNGGFGWGQYWEIEGEKSASGYHTTDVTPFKYGSLKHSKTYGVGGHGYSGGGRLLDTSATGAFSDYIKESSGLIGKTGTTLWISSLYRFNTTENSFFALSNYGFPYHHGSRQGIGVGRINSVSSEYISMAAYTAGTDNSVRTAVSNVPLNNGEDIFFVVKLDFVSDTETKVDCYINPDIWSEPTGEPSMSMTVTGFDSSFRTFGFGAGIGDNSAAIDAFRIGTDYRAVVPLLNLEERKKKATAEWSENYTSINRDRYTAENLGIIDGYNVECLSKIDAITDETSDADIEGILAKYIDLTKSVEQIITFFDGALVRRTWTNVGDGNIAALESFMTNSRYTENKYDAIKVVETATNYNENVGDNLVVSHIGYIRAPQTGTYTFRIQGSDDAVRLDINGEKVAYHDGYAGSINATDINSSEVCEVELVAGQRTPIDIMYKEAGGGDIAWIQWKGPGIADDYIDIQPKYLSCTQEYVKDADSALLDAIQGVYPEIFLTHNAFGIVEGFDPTGYTLNQEVTLTATPIDTNACYFAGWKVDGEDMGDESAITITMNKDYEIEAVFEYKSIDDYKSWAKGDVASYVDKADYRTEEQTDIDAILTQANADIDAAATIAAINELIAGAKASLDEIPTDVELSRQELAPYGAEVIAKLNTDANYDSFRVAERAKVEKLVDDAEAEIHLATTREAIEAIYTITMAAIDEIPTDAELTAAEEVLKAAKEAAVAELEAYNNENYDLYYEDQQGEMDAQKDVGKAAINAAESIDAVNSALSAAKSKIDLVLISEMKDFVDKYSDTSTGLLAYDGFIGNIGCIGSTNTGVGFAKGYTYEAGGGVDHMAITTENPLKYENLLSSTKYLTYLKSYYGTAKTFNSYDGGSINKAGYAENGFVGVNGANKPVYYSALMRIGSSGQNMIQFHEGDWYWHNNARKFAVGCLSANDGLTEGSQAEDGNKYWALRTYDDANGTAKIVRTNKIIDKKETVFVVLKVEFNYDSDNPESESKISLYLNPKLTEELPAIPDAEIATTNNLRFRSFSQLESNTDFDIDEIRLGTSFEAVAPLGNNKLPITKVVVKGDAATIAGGTIMGSNDSATNGFETIDSIPKDNTEDVVELTNITNTNSYRFIKFYGQAGSYGKVSELEFYSGTRKLEGEPFGTVCTEDHDAAKTFDGDVETYFEGQVADDQYVGLDLGGETEVVMPEVDVEPGRYEQPIEVKLSCATEDATIYYTTDGTAPSRTNGKLYSEPIQLNTGDSVVIKAVAIKHGLNDSTMLMAAYGIGVDAPVVEGLTVYMLGNSLVDTVTNGELDAISKSSGYAHSTFRKSIPGAAIIYHYLHKDAGFGYPWITTPGETSTEKTDEFSDLYYDAGETSYYINPDKARYAVQDLAPLDILTIQPFNNGDYYNDEDNNNVIEPTTYFYEMAKKYNPGIRLLLYSSWTGLVNTDDFETNNQSYIDLNENMADHLNALYIEDPEVNVVPNIQALFELRRQINAGEFPGGVTDFTAFAAADVETDSLHLSAYGRYLIGLTTYVTMYKTTPVGKVTYKPDGLTDEQALAMQKIAYDVNVAYEYSGVSASIEPEETTVPDATDGSSVEPTATATPKVTEQPIEPTELPGVETEKPTSTPTVEPTEEPTENPIPIAALGFECASLTLQENLTINYKVDGALFETVGYTNPYIKFVMGDEEKIVTEYRVEGNKYVFDYENIVPHQMNETISATLYAEFNDVTYSSVAIDYSVATYCYSMLNRYTSDEYAEFRTLLVDLLEYGAMSQEYMGYNTDNLVTTSLTEIQKSWGTSTDRELVSVTNTKYETIDNPTVSWRGAGLNLQESVGMRFKIQVSDIDNLSVKITSDDGGEWIIPSEKFEATTGGYYVYFDKLNAGQMSEPVCLTVYDSDVAVSNTVRYSIESYVAAQQNSSDAKLVALIKAMMKYGDSAKAYIS